jgi:hypothetical protein
LKNKLLGRHLVGQLVAALAQPLLGRLYILENLQFEGQQAGKAGGEDIRVPVSLHDVRYIAQPQAHGLRHPHIAEPVEAVEPGALQLVVIVEQQGRGHQRRVVEVGVGPGLGFERVHVALPGSAEPALVFVVGQGTGTVVDGVGVDVEKHVRKR